VPALVQNIRYAIRLFARNPGFTAAAVACLALGIGATTAIFSVVNAVLLRPLPYAQSGRLIRIFTEFPNFPNGGLRHFWVSPPEFLDLKRDTKSFAAIEGWVNGGVNLAGAAEPVRTTASNVSGGMLSMLGVHPVLGRVTSADDDRPNVPLTAVISYGLWQRAFGGDAGIIGRDIRLNGNPCNVIGIMPPGFAFPPGELDPPELWVPLQIDPARPGGRGSHFLSVLGRLNSGVTEAQAQAEMVRYEQESTDTIGQGRHPFNHRNHPIVLAGFQDEVVKGVRRAMLVLLGAVIFVLLIACVNVANLLLARSESRRKEIAVRAAIGAGIGKLLQQFVVEGVLLSLAGAALGILLAFGGLRLLVATNAGSIPRVSEIGIDWQVLLFTLVVSVATGIVFGLAPIVHTRPGTLHDTLKSAAGRATGTATANRFRAVLVTAELALALVLLIGSGLMVKAFWKLQEVNAGFNPDKVLSLRLALPATAYRDAGATGAFYQALSDRINALPGVVSAANVTGLPPGRQINANDTDIEGFVPKPGGPIANIDYYNNVGPRYFETIGAHLIEGRFFNAGDGASSTPVAIVNQTLARTYWPNESAIGHRIKSGGAAAWRNIVGVVADIKNGGIDRTTGTELYFPFTQAPQRTSYLVIRTQGDPMSIANAVRSEIRSLDRALPVANLRTLDEVMDTARSRPRFLTLLLTLFSSLSLALAALGIYGVISYSVAQRTNEIGIRMALGAQGMDVLRLVGAAGIRLAIAGIAIGAAGALALTRTMSGLLFGVSSVDPATFLLMAGALACVTLFACYIPARRAAKVDPLIALRYE
jgi:putative ABC transport system permease protein